MDSVSTKVDVIEVIGVRLCNVNGLLEGIDAIDVYTVLDRAAKACADLDTMDDKVVGKISRGTAHLLMR